LTDRYAGLGKETTYQTAVAATVYADVRSERIEPDHGVIIPESASRRAFQKFSLGAYRARGPLEIYAGPRNGASALLEAVLGKVTTTENVTGQVWTHVFDVEKTIPSFTLRLGVELAERILAGCLLNSLEARFAFGEDVIFTGTVFHGKPETKGTLGTPTISPEMHFSFTGATISIAGTASESVSEARVLIENTIPFDRGVIGKREFPWIKVGKRKVTGSLSLFFDSTTEYDRFLAGTTFALQLKAEGREFYTGYKFTLQLDLPKCLSLRGTAPMQDRRELFVLDAPFQAFYDDTSGYEIQARVINDNASPWA